ncbi:MAG: phage integrase SAM-like domain-containing protein [Tenacibaculum sp.]|nr:phage integrase SAM-like domain-containing protein [Tenacibaculum sp.]
MATCTYFLRATKDTKYSIINISFSWVRGISPFRKSLGVLIPSTDWDNKKQLIKHTDNTYKYVKDKNKMLVELREYFLSEFNKSGYFDKYEAERVYTSFFEKDEEKQEVCVSDYVIDFINKFIEEAPKRISPKTKKPVSKRSIQDYRRTRDILKGYEKKNKVKLKFIHFDRDFYYDIVKYLELEEDLTNKNTVGAVIKNIRTFTKNAERQGVKIHKDTLSSDFVVTSEVSPSVYLNEEEIKILFEYDFSNNKRYENVRDWCVIGCWIGLRVSDWNRIGEIKDDLIIIKPKKTLNTSGIEVVIPLHWQIKEIIKDRGFPKNISSVEYNRVIKEVCKEVGIDELCRGSLMVKDEQKNIHRKKIDVYPKYRLISSHTCRRSFATNLYKSDFPTYSIMQITGHRTEKAFLNYIKVTPKEHAIKLKKHWDKYYSK